MAEFNPEVELFNEASDIKRLNDLFDQLTEKRFSSAHLCAATIRAALDLYGILLPVLDIEGPYQNGTSDGHAIIINATSPAAEISAPPVECEHLFKIHSKDSKEQELDNDLYLYFVVDQAEDNFFDCYAQIVTGEEADDLFDDNNFQDKDYPELVGDSNGATPWTIQQRHASFADDES